MLHNTISIRDLSRFDWKRQNDVVREAFVLAAMYSDLGPRALFVDGHMSRAAMAKIGDPARIKTYINRRCHDCGLTMRRMFVLDTVTTDKMGGRAASRDKLHVHGMIELPDGWSQARLTRLLGRVFGVAPELGQRQFHLSAPDWTEHYSHNGVRASGPLGKLLYDIRHAGPTYRLLGLNDDAKRSRRAPASRGRDNRNAKRLAKPTFNAFGFIYEDTNQNGYTQVYRNGVIEALVSSIALTPFNRDAAWIGADDLELRVRDAMRRYLGGLAILDVQFPIVASLSLLHIRGAHVDVGGHGHFSNPQPIAEDQLDLPAIMLDHEVADGDWRRTLRPIFDALANASGMTRASNWDANGNYIERRS